MRYSYGRGLANGYALGLASFALFLGLADEFIELEILFAFFRNPVGISLKAMALF